MLINLAQKGLGHMEATVGAMVEVIHAFTVCDLDYVPLATKHYINLLVSPDPLVSFSAKQALIRALRPCHRRRRVFIPSPPRCSSLGGAGDDDDDVDDRGDKSLSDFSSSLVAPPMGVESLESPGDLLQVEADQDSDQYEPMVLEPTDQNPQGNPIPLEELLNAGGNFPPMVDIPPDADDETMVELAIALSLQDQSGNNGGPLSLQDLAMASQGQGSLLFPNSQSAASFEGGHLSDTTASAPGSDDEIGSNAATDGSTLRTSPAEQAGSAGSESGGSVVDSVSVSGRSSVYGDAAHESATTGARSETSSVGVPSSGLQPEGEGSEGDTDQDTTYRLHSLRLLMLERFLEYLPGMKEVGGVRAIPFLQVVLMLTSDLDGDEEKDKAALDNLLTQILQQLHINAKDVTAVAERSPQHEVKLVLLRFLSVLLSRTKAGSKPSNEISSFLSKHTTGALVTTGLVDYCLHILKHLLSYWKQCPATEDEASVTSPLLKAHPMTPPPDMSPFFLRQYVKGHAADVFEDYPQLLTEMALRLPYQMKKISDSAASIPNTVFDQIWFNILSEYMMTQQTPFVKRQVRKLLLFICGTKEKYRQLRDLHGLENHIKAVIDMCAKIGLDQTTTMPGITLPYDTLLTLIEHLKACAEIASTRAINWQMFCHKDQAVLPFLIRASIALDEGVAPVLLQLLQCALCGGAGKFVEQPTGSTSSPSKQKKSRDSEKEAPKDVEDGTQKSDDTMCVSLVQRLNKTLDRHLMTRFIRSFLLESNSTNIRWQGQSLILNIHRNSGSQQQETLLDLMWELWPELPQHGRKAAQFVDLLGYFMLKTQDSSEKKTKEYLEKAVKLLEQENLVLTNHPNATIYNMLQGLVDFGGYYLESDPCLVCNNPEIPYANLKLSAIKDDSKFTTTTQIVKLIGSHVISKISARVSDLKRTKMVRVINIYYNNRTVQGVVELKNRPGLWHKARKVTLTAGQTDVRVEFPIPIVACNLMIEYADFYDNVQATSETLQCPRCSASVPANPGVCGNCGENVFQCHKCRSINYDEKDPFLCNSCGFCKYAKFDFTLTAKPCCAVDPIENEDDRKKAISSINSLLEKADKIYKQLQMHRPALETLMVQVTESGCERAAEDVGGSVAGSSVNRGIQFLAQKYCVEAKSSYAELSKIIQKVLACRKELVDYDRQQQKAAAGAAMMRSVSVEEANVTEVTAKPKVKDIEQSPLKPSNCYGCASAVVEHCITMLRALASNFNIRQILCGQGMIQELIDYNLRRGTLQVRSEVRSLLCLLTQDNRRATEDMNRLLMTRIAAAIKSHLSNPDLGTAVRHEMFLLAESVQKEDSCWEQRVRSVVRLFLLGVELRSPMVMDSITLPCLRILQHLVQPDAGKKNKDKVTEIVGRNLKCLAGDLHVSGEKWLQGDPKHSFAAWRQKLPGKGVEPVAMPTVTPSTPTPVAQKSKADERKETREKYLQEKYGYRWIHKMWKDPGVPVKLTKSSWLRQALFSPSSRSARQTACSIIEAICSVTVRKQEIVNLLTSYLDDIGKSGECAAEYLALFKRLISPVHWKYYLVLRGILLHLGHLITQEVEHLQKLEETTLNSDLAQGFALKALTGLLATFVEQENIKQHYKNKLVGYVLNGYLSLRKLVVQRTKLIDETQDKLLELLEELTTGTDSETREFMSVCIETVQKYPLDDYRSPVFIFERLCSIIYPEENDVSEFFLILEKDPQQEDFLQGRMLGNPYSSSEPSLGPLMRDVKNKICHDCELVALLEDDTGMELLVNKKIISLDLPVKEVYKKIWAPEHGEGEPMPIIYRMRGLLGDATEDMVNSLDNSTEEDVDKEEVYKMASVLRDCGGLHVMLQRLYAINDLVLGRQVMAVLLKLFSYAVNVKANRQELIKPRLNTVAIMLRALNIALLAEQEGSGALSGGQGQTITEQILQIMEVILMEASSQDPEQYKEFSRHFCDKDQLMMLLERINSPFVRGNPTVLQALMRLIPFLAFGEEEMMSTLVNHFLPYLDFNKFDREHTQDEQVHLDCFCVIANGIEGNANGHRLKDMILDRGIVKVALDYIRQHAPPVKTLLATDSDDWKEFVSKSALRFVLRLLTGLGSGHSKTQELIGADCLSVLHKLEQVSSDEHVGTLAENLLEALKHNKAVTAKIEEIRQQTKAEKKRLAMAMRKKQLGELGMTTNEKGQVTVTSAVLKQMEDLKEETGLTCCICREGYRNQPQKVLGIYTFTKRLPLEEFENKQRKTQGYSTVSHFNLVHIDCHMAAVRHARGREEWESAALQNANTKCNGLLPLWGPQVHESAFATSLARHNTYLQECTGVRDASYTFTVHDLKNLAWRFAEERSFSEDSGGGGPQSNVYLLPYLAHMALYVINTTRTGPREEKNVMTFLESAKEKWLENCFEVESPMYFTALSILVIPPDKWQGIRVKLLSRLLLQAHARKVCQAGAKTLTDKGVKEYNVYRRMLIFFGLLNTFYEKSLKKVAIPADSSWPQALADHIRNSDRQLTEAGDRVLSVYQDELLPCESFSEFCDVTGLLEEISNPDGFMGELLTSVP